MKKIPAQTTNEYDNISRSNPSLITAGFPSGSIMTSRLIHPSSTIKQNHHCNQNRATDTQPITFNSQKTDHSQCTTLSHRTQSDTYLNLSRKDINDVMTALHTLAQYVRNDIDNQHQEHRIPLDDHESQHLTMLYSKSTNHTFKSSTPVDHYYYHPPRRSVRNRRHSLSSDRWLNHQHHIKHHRNLAEEFQHDLYNMKRKQERQILRHLQYYQKYFNHPNSSSYPSYSSNAILYASTCGSHIRSKQTYHCSRSRQSRIKIPLVDRYQQPIQKKLSSSIPLSPDLLDQFIYIDQKEPVFNTQMLPQQAQTLQILQNNQIHSLTSSDSLNTKDILRNVLTAGYLPKRNHQQISGMGDQLTSNKIDVATQWSLQILSPKSIEMDESKSTLSSKIQDNEENSKLHVTRTHSTILTKLSQSITTIATNNSAVNIPLISKIQSVVKNLSSINDPCHIKVITDTNDDYDFTKSETERLLTSLNLPTCKCPMIKLQTVHTSVQQSSIDDNITCISLDDNSSFSSLNKKKTKQTTIKLASKRPRHHTSKSSKNNPTIKRSRLHRHCQSNNRSITVTQSYETRDQKEDSSLDFFDIDTTFSDGYDRLFTDTTISEQSA